MTAERQSADQRQRNDEPALPDEPEVGVGEDASQGVEIDETAPPIAHRGRFEGEPAERADEREGDRDGRAAPPSGPKFAPYARRGEERDIGVETEERHRRKEMD